jgi:hypothetical protein
MLSPFDIRFFRELRIVIEAEIADFRAKVASAKDFADVKYHLGYVEALEDIIKEGEELENKITSGKE